MPYNRISVLSGAIVKTDGRLMFVVLLEATLILRGSSVIAELC